MTPIAGGSIRLLPALLTPLLALLATPSAWGQSPTGSFVNFESGQVRPLALSPDGTRLFAVNTPDNRLELFDVGTGGLTHTGSVSVGLDPVAVAARNDGEVWVVNHLSDSISVVDVTTNPPHVKRTVLTCDEPRDIVFAGPGGQRAFITTARRGQNCPLDPLLTTAGTGRAVVQVYDAVALETDTTRDGTPLANIVLFGDTPRALARSGDGNTVYAAVFQSGNQTTALNEGSVCNGGAAAPPCGGGTLPGGLPAPNVNIENIPGPEVGLIVKFNQSTGVWEDELSRNWNAAVPFNLPDLDVFAINASAVTPAETANFPHVGTVLFNMVTNPVTGKVYVTNTEAKNEVRFEGPGAAFGSTSVQGHLHETRITVLDGGNVLPRHLNKHIDYAIRPAPHGVKEHSLATPVGLAVTNDGATLYVAAFGSSKLGVFSTSQLEADTFVPNAASHIPLTGGGPTGIVLDEANDRLYTFTRFDNSISIVQLSTATEVAHLPVYNPEPEIIRAGRPFLYDATVTSSNGEASCSSCHVFGDFDSLAWDLGNPDDVVLNNPQPFRIPTPAGTEDFHPLKGPMTTQSLRGMADHGSMHWRGDRTGGNDINGSVFDEQAAFRKFNPAFEGLIGREEVLAEEDMEAFTDFILTVAYPPNPVRRLSGVLTNMQQLGRDFYFGPISDVLFNCNGCHTLDPANGFFGGDGFTTFEGETQPFKVPHLRNVYQKVGMFSVPGDQVRGFGILHDGSVDTIFRFLGASVFQLTNADQRRLEQFVLAFDSNMAPVVGQQITASSLNSGDGRLDLLVQRATLGECELTVKGTLDGEARGGMLVAGSVFQLDRADEAPIADLDLRALALVPGQELTYTCVPLGSGVRIALDRDEDGTFDRDELDLGTNPSDPGSFPVPIVGVRASQLKLRDDDTPRNNPSRSKLSFKSDKYRGVAGGVTVPAFGAPGDPTLGGATVAVQRADGAGTVTFVLPTALWKRTGNAAKPGYQYRDRDGIHGPITTAKLRDGELSLKGKGAGIYQLDGAPQGTMRVRFRLGATVEFCAVAPATEPATKNDTTGKFTGRKNADAPADCPDLLIP